MEPENYDLENKINLIYDYNYNLNNQNCFSYDKITMGKISLDDIKISLPDSNPDSIKNYESNKNDVLDGKFKLLGYDDENKSYLLKKYSNQFSLNIKINFYTNIKKIESLDDKINNDSLFSYLLSELILSKKTNHIQLPIMNIDIKFNEIEHLINNDLSYSNVKKDISNGKLLDICCLHLREHFFRSITLEEFLKDNKCQYKPLLFQIIHTLAVIQNEFEGFRHNNLKLNNIFVYLKKNSDSYVEYEGIKKDKFYVPNPGFDIKITNFENAVIPKFYGISNYSNPLIKFADQPNQYYDLFTFLNDLLEGTSKMSFYNDNKCDDKTKKFLDIIFPPHIRGLNNEKMTKNIVIARPIDLLDNEYFDEYRNKPSKNYSKEILTNHQYLTGKINTFMDSDNYSTLGQQDKIKSNHNIMITNLRTLKDDVVETSKIKRKTKKNSMILDDIDDDEQIINKRIIKEDFNSEKIIRNNLKGGSDNLQTMSIKAEKNSPFVSNEQKEINKKRTAENPVREPPVLLEQKLYDTSQKPPPKPQHPPSFIPLYDENGTIANQLYPYTNVRNQPPVQKAYTINLTGPTTNLTAISRIYEDVLPGEPKTFTALSIFEREQLITFLRNSMITTSDGEEMSISGGKNTLLSYIKLMDINPYSLNKNPYLDLPRNFLLYRAAYPVRYDDKTQFISIGKPSMGINIRLYMMSLGDLRCKTINNNINSDNFDLWREIKYYDIVRSQIIKRKLSPNFIVPILYKIDSESKIDWNKLDIIKSNKYPGETLQALKINQKLINAKHNLDLTTSIFNSLIPNYFRDVKNVSIIVDTKKKDADLTLLLQQQEQLQDQLLKLQKQQIDIQQQIHLKKQPGLIQQLKNLQNQQIELQKKLEEIYKLLLQIQPNYSNKEDISINSGKMLILLTEAPTSNIIQWSSTIYENFGSVKKMISSGYHSPEVWKSILFQLIYACAVLQKMEIYMENFSLENNVYIKDISFDPNSIGSWIYKIDGIDYYVPNYGYILMIDSKYADVETNQQFINTQSKLNQKFKIYGKIYNENSDFDMNNIKSRILSQFKSVMHPDNFRHNLRVKGGSIPPDEIITLLENLEKETFTSIKDSIPKIFNEFVHNRVGTLLTKSEVELTNSLFKPKFTPGMMLAYRHRNDQFIWVILKNKINQNSSTVLIKEKNIYSEKPVQNKKLYCYPTNEKIIFDNVKNMKFDESYIYETYNFDAI
jgi:hypothetical protein